MKISQTDKDALEVMELNDVQNGLKYKQNLKALLKNIILIKIKVIKNLKINLKKITLAYSQLKKTLGKKMSAEQFLSKPDIKISVKQTFGFDSEMEINAFSKKNEYVPKLMLIINLIKIQL